MNNLTVVRESHSRRTGWRAPHSSTSTTQVPMSPMTTLAIAARGRTPFAFACFFSLAVLYAGCDDRPQDELGPENVDAATENQSDATTMTDASVAPNETGPTTDAASSPNSTVEEPGSDASIDAGETDAGATTPIGSDAGELCPPVGTDGAIACADPRCEDNPACLAPEIWSYYFSSSDDPYSHGLYARSTRSPSIEYTLIPPSDPRRAYTTVSVSPDGTALAFVHNSDTGGIGQASAIGVMDLQSGEIRERSLENGLVYDIDWSPTGEQLMAGFDPEMNHQPSALRRMDAETLEWIGEPWSFQAPFGAQRLRIGPDESLWWLESGTPVNPLDGDILDVRLVRGNLALDRITPLTTSHYQDVAISPAGDELALIDFPGRVGTAHADTGERIEGIDGVTGLWLEWLEGDYLAVMDPTRGRSTLYVLHRGEAGFETAFETSFETAFERRGMDGFSAAVAADDPPFFAR